VEAGVVEEVRGGVVEARHRVHAVVVDSDGAVLASAGDPEWPCMLRSAAKPLQALPAVRDGVIERYRLGSFADGSQERLSTLASSLWDKRRDQTDVSERCRQYVLDYHSPEVVSGRWLEVLGIHTRVTAAESGVA